MLVFERHSIKTGSSVWETQKLWGRTVPIETIATLKQALRNVRFKQRLRPYDVIAQGVQTILDGSDWVSKVQDNLPRFHIPVLVFNKNR